MFFGENEGENKVLMTLEVLLERKDGEVKAEDDYLSCGRAPKRA